MAHPQLVSLFEVLLSGPEAEPPESEEERKEEVDLGYCQTHRGMRRRRRVFLQGERVPKELMQGKREEEVGLEELVEDFEGERLKWLAVDESWEKIES